MATLTENITAYESMQRSLELDHLGKWVVFHDKKLEGFYDSFESAAESAVENFGIGPYLIRQIGVAPITLPASAQFRPVTENVFTSD